MLKTGCRICGSSRVEHILEIPALPALANRLTSTREQARRVTCGSMRLIYCRRCTHLSNDAFDASIVAYDPQYENSLHFSDTFQAYAWDLARRLTERHALHGKKILEVGAGRGDFLRMLCDEGENRGVGIDPSSSETQVSSDANATVQAGTLRSASVEDVDFACCRHTLEHVPDPVALLRRLRVSLQRDDVPVPLYFEVPNAVHMVEQAAVWDLIYEHCSYFTSEAIRYAFNLAGLRVLTVKEVFGNQYLAIDAEVPVRDDVVGQQPPPPDERLLEKALQLAASYQASVERWRKELSTWRDSGLNAVVWGAGSKGVSFLNAVDPKAEMERIVDINPRKVGRFVPVTGHRVVSPDSLLQAQPDVVLVLNPLYIPEIDGYLRALGLRPKMAAAA